MMSDDGIRAFSHKRTQHTPVSPWAFCGRWSAMPSRYIINRRIINRTHRIVHRVHMCI
eukprot:04235.XXX_146518_146691_1 [CDS] Oithona nana genome sequencing.